MQVPVRYTVHGLKLACNVPLGAPGLRVPIAVDDGPADVTVELVGVPPDWEQAPAGRPPPGWRLIVEPTGGWLAVSPSGRLEGDWTHLRFGYADHHVQFDIVGPGAARVVATWAPGVVREHVETLLLTTVMGYLLRCHGRLALHASAVAWEGAAFVFAGVQGAGKSTMVAALAQWGCIAIGDDVAALARQCDGWAVWPGLTGIRLTPEARAALAVPTGVATPLWPSSSPHATGANHSEDRAVVSFGELPGPGSGAPLPLAGIFVLPSRSDAVAAPCITAVRPAEAVVHLAGQVLTPAWVEPTVDAKRFAALADMARQSPVRLVQRPDSLAQLPQLRAAIVDEMERLRR